MKKRPLEPLLWLAFSAGGVISAFLAPALLFLFALAFPLGWLVAPDYAQALAVFGHPVARAGIIVLCSLSLFHWAHRFRYTLYDGLQIKHLNELVNTICYGGAIIGSILSVWLALRIP
jgi:fumarate reductase subunit D